MIYETINGLHILFERVGPREVRVTVVGPDDTYADSYSHTFPVSGDDNQDWEQAKVLAEAIYGATDKHWATSANPYGVKAQIRCYCSGSDIRELRRLLRKAKENEQ